VIQSLDLDAVKKDIVDVMTLKTGGQQTMYYMDHSLLEWLAQRRYSIEKQTVVGGSGHGSQRFAPLK
jgi:catalase (peroxidase I)